MASSLLNDMQAAHQLGPATVYWLASEGRLQPSGAGRLREFGRSLTSVLVIEPIQERWLRGIEVYY